MGCYGDFFEKAKPYIAMISLQFGYAGMNVITKVSLNHGMSHYVLVVYRHAFATVSIAPFALILERKVRPKMTWSVFLQIFVLALLGPVIDQNFYYAGLKFTGPTFACAMSNILPAMTFVMAVIFRMEKVDLKKVRCQAKVAGTLVTVAGAMMMTLYKGPLMKMAWSSHVQAHGHGAEAPVAAIDPSGREWFLGSLFVIIATLAWASLFILQAHTLKHYAAPLSLTTLICFVGTLQAIVVTFAMEHRPSVWTIGFDMNLLAAAYAGIVTSSIAYYVQGLVIQKTGPVFASAFSPLMMIIVAVMGSFILSEKIFLGGVLGAVLIVMGLYSVLWGKHKEAEEEERREQEAETQTRRRRGRPKRRHEPESEDEEPEEEEPREEENTEAVPVGDPIKVTGKGKKQNKHYNSFEYEGNTFELEDPVLLTPEDRTQKPYVAILKDITETEGGLNVTGQWFYRPEEADKKGGGNWVARDTRELFYSFHIDDVPAESVMHKCVVHFIPQHKQIPSRKQHPGFIVQKVYDAVEKKLWNLTDKDYEDNKQQEIDLLVKKTIDRIGQLPDLEPEETPMDNSDHLSNKRGLRKRPVNPIDVSREPLVGKSDQFPKAETPGSDNLRNYDVLVRYKALYGEKNRDRWLDKLVDCIPLASKESARASHADPDAAAKSSTNGSSAKDVGSADNEKSYAPDVVVPIMVALERSAYEALGNDFLKYNQKLRQLVFNIKISSKLRSRLMDKELDPPVLLTMSPDELKVGLTSAEKTSEPEESRQLQMTDTRCERCNEKKVGISDIIHAGHGDRYQLECTSCGLTWFSSRDAITTLTEDAPSTAGNVGTAPWATAKFDILEKQLTSPRGQPDKPAADPLQKSTAAYMPTLEKQKSFVKPKPGEPSPAVNQE